MKDSFPVEDRSDAPECRRASHSSSHVQSRPGLNPWPETRFREAVHRTTLPACSKQQPQATRPENNRKATV